MKTVLIESPNKIETLKKYLGNEYQILATMGHIRDLPAKSLAVNVNDNFAPKYEIIKDKKKVVDQLVYACKRADDIYLASDPDREGEAISWHLCHILGIDPKDAKRVTFNELTKDAILEGLKHPRAVDMSLVDAQQARRVLDRLIGYKLSPLISKKIKSNLSAGRVQSVVLKLIVMREKEILAFVPVEYWDIDAYLIKDDITFKSSLHSYNGKKYTPENEQQAKQVVNSTKGKDYIIDEVKKSVTSSNAPAPYITSTLQQDAINRLRMSLKSYASSAQSLYEGVEIHGEGKVALITYIRTDSTRVAETAQASAKEYINNHYGEEYTPAKYNVYKTKKSSQDAHEAIRPVSLKYTPEYLKGKMDNNLYKLYCMIFNRFLASQMTAAKYNSVRASINVSGDGDDVYTFRATGRTKIFAGYTALYANDETKEGAALPILDKNDLLSLEKLVDTQKFTQPPARYNDSSITKEMEEQGIGRPATFGATVMTLYNRQYIEKDGKAIKPTELGITVTEYLDKYFTEIMNIEYTAEMETKLDEIEYSGKAWQDSIRDFYYGFDKALDQAYQTGEVMKRPPEETDIVCEKCGSMMLIRDGRFGKFLACSNFPKCKNAKNIENKEEHKEENAILGKCPDCGKTVSAKHSKRGKIFYGCDGYPDCTFMSWDLPLDKYCEICNGQIYAKINNNKITKQYCINKECENNKGI